MKNSILLACVHNSVRSQIAEGLARHFSKDSLKIESAGTNPLDEVNPLVVEAMKEKGV